jgi:hypothetical protein
VLANVRFAPTAAVPYPAFRELNPRQLTRNFGPPLTPQRVQFSPLPLVVARFSLICRCTHRAHATFQLIEKLELSLQSIQGYSRRVVSGSAVNVIANPVRVAPIPKLIAHVPTNISITASGAGL